MAPASEMLRFSFAVSVYVQIVRLTHLLGITKASSTRVKSCPDYRVPKKKGVIYRVVVSLSSSSMDLVSRLSVCNKRWVGDWYALRLDMSFQTTVVDDKTPGMGANNTTTPPVQHSLFPIRHSQDHMEITTSVCTPRISSSCPSWLYWIDT